MKKGIALVLSLCMLVAVFAVAGCASTPENSTVKLGLGQVTSIAKSKDAAEGTTAVAQADTTMAAVVLDKDGKIVAVRIDTAQTKVNFDAAMVVTNRDDAIKTKKEKGHEYGMGGASGIGKEWHEQIAALEEWMVGKTIEEVKGLQLKDNVPDVPELTSSVTIKVDTYLAAVEKAVASAVEVENYATLGLGHTVSIGKSKDATAEAPASAQINTTFAATAFDKDGKVVGALVDVTQAKVAFDAEGKVTSDKAAAVQSKKELGDDYGMKGNSGIGKEWHEQMTAFEAWMVGKDTFTITNLKVKVVNDSHQNVPDVPELTSSVTITVEDYLASVLEAFRYKK